MGSTPKLFNGVAMFLNHYNIFSLYATCQSNRNVKAMATSKDRVAETEKSRLKEKQ